jgi:hypothetical protein
MGLRHDLDVIWHDEVVKKGQRPRLLVLLSFLLSFVVIRGVTYSIRYNLVSFLHNIVTPNGIHIHHLVFGIVGLLIVGYVAIDFDLRPHREIFAVLYGISAALTLDEFALWLNLSDVYWAQEGRLSIDVVLFVAALIGIVWICSGFLVATGRRMAKGRTSDPGVGMGSSTSDTVDA